jgi:hypothetical protein
MIMINLLKLAEFKSAKGTYRVNRDVGNNFLYPTNIKFLPYSTSWMQK